MDKAEITTYPEMNSSIKKLLKLAGDNCSLYALARIEELEKAAEQIREEALEEAVLLCLNKYKEFGNDIYLGHTKGQVAFDLAEAIRNLKGGNNG